MTKTQKQKQFGWLVVSLIILALAGIFLIKQKPLDSQTVINTAETGSELVASGPLEVKGETVNYFNGSQGFYVSPSIDGSYPGVVMIHEWWGLNDNIRSMAKTLASNGYRVLAVDLYSGTVAKNMQEAQKLVSGVNQSQAISNMKAAKKYLLDKQSPKVAVLGWCFGGGQSLQLSLSEKDLSATVIYYGQLSSDSAKLKNITWPVLGIFGDKDASISVASVRAFEAALDKNKTPNEIYIYEGVGHAFANPSGANYAPAETKDAWTKTIEFLARNLK